MWTHPILHWFALNLPRAPGRIDLFDKSRDGVSVRLFADKSEWKTVQETRGEWAPLWSGTWITATDLRPAFKKWGLSPMRQGERGTCSVFVTKSALGALAAGSALRQGG